MVVLYDITSHPLLGEKYNNLGDAGAQEAQQMLAETLLNLQDPVYTGDDADRLQLAIVRQINFQLDRGITTEIMKAVSNSHPGNVSTFRDRYLDATAWAIVMQVTKIAIVGFSPTTLGI